MTSGEPTTWKSIFTKGIENRVRHLMWDHSLTEEQSQKFELMVCDSDTLEAGRP